MYIPPVKPMRADLYRPGERRPTAAKHDTSAPLFEDILDLHTVPVDAANDDTSGRERKQERRPKEQKAKEEGDRPTTDEPRPLKIEA